MNHGDSQIGGLLVADEDVRLGYADERGARAPLVMGNDARLRSGTVPYRGSAIGDRFATGHHVVVREECSIGDDVSIWTGLIVDYGVTIGNRVKIHSNCYVSQYTVIDDGAFLAPGVTFANDLYPGVEESAVRIRGPHIGAGAQLGVGTMVLPYVRIGPGAVIGSGSVVTRDIPPGVIAFGNPAVVRRSMSDRDDVRRRVLAASAERVPR